jgi:hypothetical protein
MKKFTLAVFTCFSLLLGNHLTAQTRFLDPVFTNVQVTNDVLYAQNYEYQSTTLTDLKMDVYQPTGDTASKRPLIILMHAGSFLSPNITGFQWATRQQNCLVELANRFAKRGYVVASVSYRLGWNPLGDDEQRAKTIIQAVYRAMQDGKSAVRYFKKDFSTTNTYKIDTCKIFVGGTNSGAYVALAIGNLNRVSETNLLKFRDNNGRSFVQQDTLGDFDGFNGVFCNNNHTGYSSQVAGILSLGGAVGDTSWVEAGEPPVVAFHGVNEQLTKYNTAVVLTTSGQPIIEVSGSGDFMPYVANEGNNSFWAGLGLPQGPANVIRQGSTLVYTNSVEGLYPFYGQGFEPWSWYDNQGGVPPFNTSATLAKANAFLDTIVNYTAPRFAAIVTDSRCDIPNSIRESEASRSFTLYPNPSRDRLSFSSEGGAALSGVNVFAFSGQLLMSSPMEYGSDLSVASLPSGTYLLQAVFEDGKVAYRRFVRE